MIALLLSEQRLREHVHSIVRKVRMLHPTLTDPRNLASELGLRVVGAPASGLACFDGTHVDGVITLRTDGSAAKERQRFTAYHEICHALLRKDDWLWSTIHDQYPSDDELVRVVERLCNVGAAEFLLPRERVMEYAARQGVSVLHIPTLAEMYGASRLATAIQLADCANHQCIMVIAARTVLHVIDEPQLIPSGRSEQSALVVEYSVSSRSTKYQAGRGTRISNGSIIAFAEGRPDGGYHRGYESPPFRSRREWRVNAEAIRLGSRIYAQYMLTAPNPVDDGQLRLF